MVTSIADPSLLPTDNEVEHNVITGNKPFDIVYDGTGSGTDFADNWCETSCRPVCALEGPGLPQALERSTRTRRPTLMVQPTPNN